MNAWLASGQNTTGPPTTQRTPLKIANNHSWPVGLGKLKKENKQKPHAGGSNLRKGMQMLENVQEVSKDKF